MRISAAFAAAAIVSLFAAGVPADDLARKASWQAPPAGTVKQQLDDYVAGCEFDGAAGLKIEVLWPESSAPASPAEMLDRAAAVFAVADADARELVALCRSERSRSGPPSFEWLAGGKPEFLQNNLRLVYGAWLARNDLYHEALERLDGLAPADVIDPASLLFYRAVANHRLVRKEACLADVKKLLENEPALPGRYAVLARLMQADIAPLQQDTLDEIARIMRNVSDGLKNGRAGARVRSDEEQIIAKLDKIIEDLEKSDDGDPGPRPEDPPPPGPPGPPGAPRDGPGGNQPGQPMPDSNEANNRGRGDVDGAEAGRAEWGDISPADRQRVLQEITRDLPAHYREVIEEYFRKIAREELQSSRVTP